ncbi:DUF1801 domain-containing protein [Polaribacter gangjinensis]|uniref:YdhG-like domain-containing protein n=1 Tax=Polaribacter gangjinensis TaxID=574710 RepID=A0A2S7WD45_9FLAO|nr:DUF1801 domain-containing protein [Polaribacter gangjinensis]PQJ75533.1 hypothetical protein BTO13_09960 [Polaribacter gangjinensis]
MTSKANTVDDYISELTDERKIIIEKLRNSILNNLPKGFEEGMQYGMIGYFVPHKIYPNGYHCNPKEPLPFMSIASQKNSVNMYHMGLYAKKDVYDWFVTEYSKQFSKKLDIGKSCIRFKNEAAIPFEILEELVQKIAVDEWISIYENTMKK